MTVCRCLVVAFLVPGGLVAQAGASGAELRTITFEDAAAAGVSQLQVLTVPFAVQWASSSVVVELSGGLTDAIMTYAGGGAAEISGPTDTKASVRWASGPYALVGHALLPTGDSGHRLEDIGLLGALSSELLPGRSPAVGTGGGFGGELRFIDAAGPWAFGFGTGYMVLLGHRPMEGTPAEFSPGGELQVAGFVSRRIHDASLLSSTLSIQYFRPDQFDGGVGVRAAARLGASIRYAAPLGAREGVSLSVGVYRRGDDKPEPTPMESPFAGMVGSVARSLLVTEAEMQLTRGRLVLRPAGEYRVLSRGDGLGDGWLASLGTAVEYRLVGGSRTGRLLIVPEVRGHLGSVGSSGASKSSLVGWEVGVSVSWAGT